MTPIEFERLGIRIHGRRWGWQTAVAARLKIDNSTVQRYVRGETVIPGPVEAAVLCLAAMKGDDDDA